MKTTRRLLQLMVILAMVFCISACSKDDDILTPDVNMGDVVTDFKKAVRYENTRQFLNDRDALSGLILELQGLRGRTGAWHRTTSRTTSATSSRYLPTS